jgi:hypothetical protein
VSLFTAIFALARTVGWIAQLNEMIGDPDTRSAARASCSVFGASFSSSIQLPGSSWRAKICWRRRSATSWYSARGRQRARWG